MSVFNIGNNSPEWVSYLLSFLLLLLGAGLAFLSQFIFERKRNRERNRRHAWSLLHTLQSLVEDLISLDSMRTESLEMAKAKNREDEAFWQKWQERIGYGDPGIRFSADELIILSSMHDNQFTTKVREVENAHRILVQSAQKLSELRTAMGEHCTAVGKDGTLVTMNPPPRALPILTKLDSLGESFQKALPGAVSDAKLVATQLGPRLKKHYRLKKFATLDYSRINPPF